jgi:hypothetical protein
MDFVHYNLCVMKENVFEGGFYIHPHGVKIGPYKAKTGDIGTMDVEAPILPFIEE